MKGQLASIQVWCKVIDEWKVNMHVIKWGKGDWRMKGQLASIQEWCKVIEEWKSITHVLAGCIE
jgi:hypothetical protein